MSLASPECGIQKHRVNPECRRRRTATRLGLRARRSKPNRTTRTPRPWTICCRGRSPGLRVVALVLSSQDGDIPVTYEDLGFPLTVAGAAPAWLGPNGPTVTGFPLSFAGINPLKNHDHSNMSD
jgi:hypothetical protein